MRATLLALLALGLLAATAADPAAAGHVDCDGATASLSGAAACVAEIRDCLLADPTPVPVHEHCLPPVA